MKRIITVCWAISILCAVYPAKADILSWLKPTPKPVVAPRHHPLRRRSPGLPGPPGNTEERLSPRRRTSAAAMRSSSAA